MKTKVGGILGLLLTIYQALPLVGVHVPNASPELAPALGTVVAFFVGLFTKTPVKDDSNGTE
jgi:hypothetical protein